MEETWAGLISSFGFPTATLIVFTAAIVKGWLVAGPTHEDVKKQRDRLLDVTLKSNETAQGSIRIVERQRDGS